jgi:hypothetical protein
MRPVQMRTSGLALALREPTNLLATAPRPPQDAIGAEKGRRSPQPLSHGVDRLLRGLCSAHHLKIL